MCVRLQNRKIYTYYVFVLVNFEYRSFSVVLLCFIGTTPVRRVSKCIDKIVQFSTELFYEKKK
jgi:hypothetical protein